jgi:hypothetical protein
MVHVTARRNAQTDCPNRATRDVPFVMTPARNDGQLGPNIQPRQCEVLTGPKHPPMPTGAMTSSGCGAMSVLATLPRAI